MAEKKERKMVATENAGKATTVTTKAERREKATGKRVVAVVFWLLAIAMEVFFILLLNKTIYFPFYASNQLVVLIAVLVLDLIFVIIGSQFWKKANDVDPASEANKVKFFLWNQMGLIVSVLAFAPLILVLLNNKELDKKTKKIVTVCATVALVIAGAFGIDYNPISEEERTAMEQTITSEVYYTPFGRKYHTHEDCQALSNSKVFYHGPIADALDAGRTEKCKFCATRDGD